MNAFKSHRRITKRSHPEPELRGHHPHGLCFPIAGRDTGSTSAPCLCPPGAHGLLGGAAQVPATRAVGGESPKCQDGTEQVTNVLEGRGGGRTLESGGGAGGERGRGWLRRCHGLLPGGPGGTDGGHSRGPPHRTCPWLCSEEPRPLGLFLRGPGSILQASGYAGSFHARAFFPGEVPHRHLVCKECVSL